MKYRIFTVLGLLAVSTGLASSVHAQSAVVSNADNAGVTLSGESLSGIRSRTVGDDLNNFFLDNSSTIPFSTVGSDNNFIARNGAIWQINEDVQLVSNRPIYPSVNSVPWEQHQPLNNQPLNGPERVEVQFNLGQ
jgi:hypothetical protein